ncbi:hypothetical protein ACNAN0_08590 [Agrilactobacillus fermenti]
MALRSRVLELTKSEYQEDVAAILILAFRKYQQQQLSQDYFNYSLMPQLVPLVKAEALQTVESMLISLIQTN